MFVNTKKSADLLGKNLDKNGYKVTILYSGKSQDQRQTSLAGFRAKKYNVLVATDVAGRGIDIPDVAHVIDVDMRILKCTLTELDVQGLLGKQVQPIFLTSSDQDVFYALKQMLVQSNSPVPPELARHENSKFKPGSIPDRPHRRDVTVFVR